MTIKWLEKTRSRNQSQKDSPKPGDWRVGLAKEQLNLEEFCALCIQALQEIFGAAKVEQTDSIGQVKVTYEKDESITMFLENIWRQCKDSPDLRVETVERFIRVLTTPKDSRSEVPPIDSIVPTIKDWAYIGHSRQEENKELPHVYEHFVGDLWILYAIDSADAIRSLTKTQLKALQVEPAQLKSIAIQNLRRILPPYSATWWRSAVYAQRRGRLCGKPALA